MNLEVLHYMKFSSVVNVSSKCGFYVSGINEVTLVFIFVFSVLYLIWIWIEVIQLRMICAVD
jgi:hypothetical protein